MKNYIGFVNDHSGSMRGLAMAACKDYNDNIAAVKEAASREMLDTVVSVVGVGYPRDCAVTRQVQISNPHVLKPLNKWATNGGTPLYDGIGSMIELLRGLPDADRDDVSMLVMVTTDGEELNSRQYNAVQLKQLINAVSATGRWTFVFRVPQGASTQAIKNLGIPAGNIQQWKATATGMQESTAATTAAMSNYFRDRSTGVRASGAFYADANSVNVAALEDVSKKVSLYVVPQEDNGIEIRPFILKHRMDYLKGAAFYQLTKTEARVSYSKQVLVRDRATGKIFSGNQARDMIGLPRYRNARLHPGDHKNFDLFIQSESVNRKLVGGTGVIYWKELGVPFTEADLAYLNRVPSPSAAPIVVQLPKVPVSTTPTKSPIPVTPRVPAVRFFETREEARQYCRNEGRPLTDICNLGKTAAKGQRWSV